MSRMDRRAFLLAFSRAGVSAAAFASLPPWSRAAIAAAARAPAAPTPVPPPAETAEMIVRNDRPEHWETSLDALGRSWITRNDRFFVRSHLSVPRIDAAAWRLELTGLVRTPLTLSLAQLKALPQEENAITLECAGNGRGLFKLPSTSGTQWQRGAVGNAAWGGVRLARLLERAEVATEGKHVWFEAADQAPVPGPPPFVRSIPIEKAMGDVMLAHAMNGEPLSELHGAPLRVVVPGWYGMASTKWVTRVRVEEKPSDNHFMVKGYRYAYPGADPAAAPPVETVHVKSFIGRPLDGAQLALSSVKPGAKPKLRVQGFAWAGPAGVRLVEASIDGGKSWSPAGFMGETAPGAWRAWATEFEVTPPARLIVMARATDGAGEVQPAEALPNAGGYGNNSIHKVTVRVVKA
jgi:DMSO/TMAO reductase YedYZ molybdopterin-dependent catalytic subunit